MSDFNILKRLYKSYTKKYLKKIFLSVFFALLLAGSTSSVAYLLDPAIKELFVKKNDSLMFVIPILIIIAFGVKGASLYIAKVIMINVSEEIRKDIQIDMFSSLIKADTEIVDGKHSGKFIANLTNDVQMIVGLVSTGLLNFFKDSFTLIGLLFVMFYQNWKLAIFAIIMIPLASYAAKKLGKRMFKSTGEQMKKAGVLNTYLIEIFKNHKLMKIFQKEKYEKLRAENFINSLKETTKKISTIFIRTSPIMEFLTGIMIACLIFIAAKLVTADELEVSNFFSFLAAMMLAYQPVRSLATLNVTIQQGLSGAQRVIPIIDNKNKINENENDKDLEVINGEIEFKNVNFKYTNSEKKNFRLNKFKNTWKKNHLISWT